MIATLFQQLQLDTSMQAGLRHTTLDLNKTSVRQSIQNCRSIINRTYSTSVCSDLQMYSLGKLLG